MNARVPGILAAIGVCLPYPATATPIAIQNHSFETDVIPRDGNTGTVGDGTDDFDASIVPAAWTSFDDGRGDPDGAATWRRGIVSTAPDSFFSASLAATPDTDANDQTFYTAAGDICQVLSATLQADTAYTLTVDIGDRDAAGAGGEVGTLEINLGTGATPGQNILATLTNTGSPATVNGGWVTWTLEFTTTTATPGLGDPLRIELTTNTNVGWFDNVRLEAGPTNDAYRLRFELETNGDNLLFTWSSREGKVYDLLSDDGKFGTDPPDTWPSYMGSSGIIPTPPENTLSLPSPPGDDAAFFVIRERDPGPAPIKVVLLGGQSNMMGSGTVVSDLPVNLQGPQNDVPFYYNAGPLTDLQPGSGLVYGPEITFGRTVADAFPNESFALIKYANGATDLENDWDPATGSVYASFRATVAGGVDALTQAGHSVEIVGMLWTQGERDARLGYSAAYEANLNAFIADVRSRYGAGLPFFISQLSSQQTDLPASDLAVIRQAQSNVAAADPNSHLIVTDAFDMRTDNLHFSSAGQISLGEAFAASYTQSAGGNP